jgi:tRNA threonylcarbamoyladenosine biosynthesis protein TsaE
MSSRTEKATRRGKSTLSLISRSPQETEEIGRHVAQGVAVPGVVLLCGALGSGKTTMTRGLARGFGLDDPALVHSPSFTIVNIYQGRCTIYHVDLYRVRDSRDLRSVGLEDFLGKDGITIIEWGERLADTNDSAVKVELQDAGDDERIIRITNLPVKTPKLAASEKAVHSLGSKQTTGKRRQS